MNWYKKAQSTNISQYLSPQEIELIEQKKHSLNLYQTEIDKVMSLLEQGQREPTPEEENRIKNMNFFVNKIQNDILKIKEKNQKSISEEYRQNIYLENLAKQEGTEGGFGLTEDIKEAGYIMRDGTMLDFSGKKEGGIPGERARDHREISSLDTIEDSGTEGMIEFMNRTGAIRILFYDGINIDIVKPITTEQMQTILQNSRRINYFQIDTNDIRGNTFWTKSIHMPLISSVKQLMEKANKQF